ncbi:hypothetical protein JNK13_04465 [bacterium]|nr:hypothetical protein [bacterium]
MRFSSAKKLLGLLVFGGLIATIAACGTASSNDQGTSFLALGFFADSTGSEGDNGTIFQILDTGEGLPTIVPTPGGAGGFIGLENRLVNQFIRTTTLNCSYNIPGSSLVVPDDAFSFTAVISPAVISASSSTSGGGTNNSLITGTKAYAQVPFVTADVLDYISNHLNDLPPLPFEMVASCRVTAITQAGDELETNPVNYTLIFVEASSSTTSSSTGDTSGDTTSSSTGEAAVE